VGDEKRWHDHRRNVERRAKKSWLEFKHDAVVVGVEKVDRAPDVENPYKRNCK
jgi:hypothetical protein